MKLLNDLNHESINKGYKAAQILGAIIVGFFSNDKMSYTSM